ncbi:MAG TPA: TIGR00730 family Rossman fold protein, partial [Planctomycetota bacterium]|nr:TIGR00730 family Rossman fold protein [Planctomycetota bacterium]
MKTICVFCGSHSGKRPAYVEAARRLGWKLAESSIDLVYGGGSIGLMGTLANAVLDRNGRAIGVIPDWLSNAEVMHEGLTELHVVSSMHERKALMSKLADGFIALPGGFGTFEEVLEIITWAQLGIQRKPIGLLDLEGYFRPLIDL